MKIALLQILPTGSLNGNREKGMEACRKAKVLGADIALFPEMWSNGYDIPEDAEALQRAAVPADGEFVSGFGKLAAELNMAIAITFLEKTEKRPRNAVSLFDRHGGGCTPTPRCIPVILGTSAVWTRGRTFLSLRWIRKREPCRSAPWSATTGNSRKAHES